jgi:hypothetical protein
MEEKVPDIQYDPLHIFFYDSDWDYRSVTLRLAKGA